MVPQAAVTIMAEIEPERLGSLRLLLATMNAAPGLVDPRNELVPFYQFRQLHFARFLIIESELSGDLRAHGKAPAPWRPTLAFLADVDGDREAFLAELAVRAGPGLRRIFSHCRDFDEGKAGLLVWLSHRHIEATANYVNFQGRTVRRIGEEAVLRQALRAKLEALQSDDLGVSPQTLFELLSAHVEAELRVGGLTLTPEPRTPLHWRVRNLLHKLLPPLLLLVLLPVLVLLLPLFLILLRRHERRDPEIVPRPERQRVEELAGLEDRLVTNQFSAFGDVKPGRFRRYTIRALLFALDYAARHVYRRGYLTRVQTIHFARWILLDDERRLLFASNYDGSLESYMDDFINKVAWGLNLVFSNGVGYPRSRWLIKGGAEQEQKFKHYLRRHQVYTDVWYKAYPDKTAFELSRNSRIREGLARIRPGDGEAISDWLALI